MTESQPGLFQSSQTGRIPELGDLGARQVSKTRTSLGIHRTWKALAFLLALSLAFEYAIMP